MAHPHTHSETAIQNGYILLADISGFDAYLSDVELEHAHGVVRELLELIVEQLTPTLQLASFEGDAVLAYAPKEDLPRGETLLELTEITYVAFRDRLKSIHRNNTCNCRACSTVDTLDLKFLVHYGEYLASPKNNEHIWLEGLDANLVRERLLKDQVQGDGAPRSYALFTEQSLKHLGVRPEGTRANRGSYPHMGEIETASMDLGERYDTLTAARHAYVSADDADIVIVKDFEAPASNLWEWLNEPEKRNRWMKWRTWKALQRPGGRTGIGASNHCAHGFGAIIETVVDWRPNDYYTVDFRQESLGIAMQITYQLEPSAIQNSTRLNTHVRLLDTNLKWLTHPAIKLGLPAVFNLDFDTLGEMISMNPLD